MSSVIFGGTLSMVDISNPTSGWIVGYDLDGKLKQKSDLGVITEIGGAVNISEILSNGNLVEYPIIMGTGTYIKSTNGDGRIDLDYLGSSSSVLISSSQSGLLLEYDKATLYAKDGEQKIELENSNGDIVISHVGSGSILLGVHNTSTGYGNLDEIKVSYNSSTASTGNFDKQSVFIGTKNSSIGSNLVNTVVIGGSSIDATQSNTVYLPDVNIKESKSIKSSNVTLHLSDSNGDTLLDRNNGSKSESYLLMTDNEVGYDYHAELVTNSSDTATSSILIKNQNADTLANYTSIKLEKESLSILTDGTTYSINLVINPNQNQAEIQGDSTLFKGLEYSDDFSLNYTSRSLVDKDYVDNSITLVSTPGISEVLSMGNNTQTRNLIMGTGTYIKSSNGGGRIDLDFGSNGDRVLISTDDSSQATSYIQLDSSNIEIQSDYIEMTIGDNEIITTNGEGLKYSTDYSSTYINRSLVDKEYVDSGTSSIWSSISSIVSGTGSSNYIPFWSDSKNISSTSSIYSSEATTENTFESEISVGTTPYNSKLNSSNRKLYVANYASNNISVINIDSGLVTATISVGTNPVEVVIKDNTVYVTNRGSNNVTYINSTTDLVTGTISVGSLPYGIESANDKIYVANQGSNNISVINTSTNLITATISGISTPRSFTYDYKLNNLWLTGIGPDYLAAIDLDTNTLAASFSVGVNPYSLEYNPNDEKVYVTNYSSNNVSVVNTSTNTISSTISVGTNPDGIKFDDINNRIYVSNVSSSSISIIESGLVVDTLFLSGSPKGLEYNPVDAKLYISNNTLNKINILETLTRPDGFIGINTLKPKSELDIKGKITTNEIRISDGAYSGYNLVSDSAGNATWQPRIIEVSGGSGLIGSGTSGVVSLSVDFSSVASVSYVNSGTTSIWNQIYDIQEDIVSINNDINSIESDISAIQSDVSDIQSDISHIQGDISTIQGDISTIQGDISTIQSQMLSMPSKYSVVLGFTASVTQTITHNLGNKEVIVQAYDDSSNQIIPGTVTVLTGNTVDITFSSTLSDVKIVIIG